MSGNRMFCVTGSVSPKQIECFKTKTVSTREAYIWHCRFEHLNSKALNMLVCKEMVTRFTSVGVSTKKCIPCLTGKQSRRPFPSKSSWRASQLLQLIHSDIAGPMQPASNSEIFLKLFY